MSEEEYDDYEYSGEEDRLKMKCGWCGSKTKADFDVSPDMRADRFFPRVCANDCGWNEFEMCKDKAHCKHQPTYVREKSNTV